MFSDELRTTYQNLNDSLTLSDEELNKSAMKLINAPEDGGITRQMCLEIITVHANYSREVYDMLLTRFDSETLTSKWNNVLHLLLSNRNTTLADVRTLQNHAEIAGNSEWFNTVVAKTIELNEYQLGLTYNGESVFNEEELRNSMTATVELLKTFQQESATDS